MDWTAGQIVAATGPDGRSHRGRVLNAYRSTGGFLSIWIALYDWLANPANRAATEYISSVLVLTERAGIYCDLWGGVWELKAAVAPGDSVSS